MYTVRLHGGPLHGQYLQVEDYRFPLKVVVPGDPQHTTGGPTVVPTRTEFYVFNGFAGRMDYQPHPH